MSLPEQYRAFITQVGNGGAGPGYGLERLVLLDQRLDTARLREQGMRPLGGKAGCLQFLVPRFADHNGVEIDPFEVSFYGLANQLLEDGFVEALRRPFPVEPTYKPLTNSGREIVPGFLPLNDYGCGRFAGLVLNGPRRGEVWVVEPNDDSVVPFVAYTPLHVESLVPDVEWPAEQPRPFTFEEWYLHWLDHALADRDPS